MIERNPIEMAISPRCRSVIERLPSFFWPKKHDFCSATSSATVWERTWPATPAPTSTSAATGSAESQVVFCFVSMAQPKVPPSRPDLWRSPPQGWVPRRLDGDVGFVLAFRRWRQAWIRPIRTLRTRSVRSGSTRRTPSSSTSSTPTRRPSSPAASASCRFALVLSVDLSLAQDRPGQLTHLKVALA